MTTEQSAPRILDGFCNWAASHPRRMVAVLCPVIVLACWLDQWWLA